MAKKSVKRKTLPVRKSAAARPATRRISSKTLPGRRPQPARPAPGPAISPKLRALGDRSSQVLDIAFQKAAAHDKRPSKYPLPSDPTCLERRAYQVLKDLPLLQRQALKRRLMDAVDASAAKRRERFADLAQVDLASSTSVIDQVRQLPVPAAVRLTAQDVERAKETLSPYFLPVTARQARGTLPQTMKARILELECLEPSKQLEIGKDEIVVSATILDDLGNVTSVGPLDFGKFEEGGKVDTPRDVYTFNLAGGTFPKSFATLYTVQETDLGETSAFAQVILKMLAGVTLVLLGVAVGVALPGPVGLVLAVILIAAGGTALGFAMGRYQIFVHPRGDNAVTFNSATEVFFADADGNPSLVSQPVIADQAVSGGRYRLTTDFELA